VRSLAPAPPIAASLILPAIFGVKIMYRCYSLLFLISFLFSYSSLLILLFLTLLTLLVGTILRLFILLFLYFKLFVVL
jgi:hypothetical protein